MKNKSSLPAFYCIIHIFNSRSCGSDVEEFQLSFTGPSDPFPVMLCASTGRLCAQLNVAFKARRKKREEEVNAAAAEDLVREYICMDEAPRFRARAQHPFAVSLR